MAIPGAVRARINATLPKTTAAPPARRVMAMLPADSALKSYSDESTNQKFDKTPEVVYTIWVSMKDKILQFTNLNKYNSP